MPVLKPMMIYNGGNIIMVQMENEYGSYGCDFDYTAFLRDQTVKHLGKEAVLYTTGHIQMTFNSKIFLQ